VLFIVNATSRQPLIRHTDHCGDENGDDVAIFSRSEEDGLRRMKENEREKKKAASSFRGVLRVRES